LLKPSTANVKKTGVGGDVVDGAKRSKRGVSATGKKNAKSCKSWRGQPKACRKADPPTEKGSQGYEGEGGRILKRKSQKQATIRRDVRKYEPNAAEKQTKRTEKRAGLLITCRKSPSDKPDKSVAWAENEKEKEGREIIKRITSSKKDVLTNAEPRGPGLERDQKHGEEE